MAAPGPALRALCERLSEVEENPVRPVDQAISSFRAVGRDPSRALRGFVEGRLSPGSYLALMQERPAPDEFGLEVEYAIAAHLVLGTLAEEDLLD
ncbi:MAG: hypothetical protein HC813_03125 [Planctomycetes bacterium]|nr:hypothetical protein [Planctomycetota bacterium]